MLIEIPEFRRCCFCLPLRRGILMFGYLSLLVTCLFTILQIVVFYIFEAGRSNYTTAALYRGVVMEAQLSVILILYTLDIVFHIVLIVGAHMKRRRLLRVYYYYELTTMVASFIVVLITYKDLAFPNWNFVITEFGLAFTGFVFQIYLLLLIRSELRKERYQEGRSSYINHIAEVFIEPPLRRQWRTAL